MADEPDPIDLVSPRRLAGRVDPLTDEVRDVDVRITSVEENTAGTYRRPIRLKGRVERIERRFDLVDAH